MVTRVEAPAIKPPGGAPKKAGACRTRLATSLVATAVGVLVGVAVGAGVLVAVGMLVGVGVALTVWHTLTFFFLP
jgi:hypothetical protein